MTAEKKKKTTYVKFALKLAVCVLIGGVIGFVFAYMKLDSVGESAADMINGVRDHLLWFQVFFLAVSVLIEEPVLHQYRVLGRALENAEDEESDLLEYRMEKLCSLGMTTSIVTLAVAMILLSTGYSMDYIESLSIQGNQSIIVVFTVFILNGIYNGLWQARYVKTVQKFYPNKNADITSIKFQEQWLENCDEAEREMIYQASYKSRLTLHKLVSFLAVVSMLCHLLWNTGIMAVVMVGIVWIAMTVTYCRACVKKKGSKLNL